MFGGRSETAGHSEPWAVILLRKERTETTLTLDHLTDILVYRA